MNDWKYNNPEVGAVWPSRDPKIEGQAYIKLPNGMYINLTPTKNKVAGDNKPLYNATMKREDAIKLGFEVASEDITSNLPF